ncbi:MbcA/ParS/Xre antitoxin family protein [Pelagibacterium sp. 26DY04]|uniref:MbcA/ParS/Xre antitoxin family protein n=1 Tax=unclassified Pelagibacterium TaxID=2623280 RepID=UPI002814C12D|nr:MULTISPECIES: MbcA/ParS/Xre antitoxin family protein [unclassified Pelagibacterium]WMT88836.1 MbcA/ParS/Xre antitoxin family protein [Pelagibacterium sp. 26DY04]WMT91123.1 MbcA/ParS/Xre antitoxin family protein [Pelagibacterium sp. H642]
MLHELPRAVAAPDLPQITDTEAAAMARAVVNLFARWDLSDAEAREILGGLTARTYARWKAGEVGRIDRDLATRLSLLMGIHKGLRYLFSDSARGYGWVKKPNTVFGGRAPVDVMAEGSIFALARIRAYLDAERGGW